MKKHFLPLLLLTVALLLSACASAQELRVDFYNMGKADSMLITTPMGKRILIDAGTNKGGKALVKRFEEENIGPIDLMIITHYDKDHVGGADKIIEDVGVKSIIMPVYDKESKQHTQFVEAIAEAGVPDVTQLVTGSETALDIEDGLSLHITAAHKSFYGRDEENDFSLAVRMRHGDMRFFFAGDAEEPRQRELLEEGDVACDVLKVPYHGRLTKASEDFLKAASPKIAFITDSDEEQGSPIVTEILESLGADVHSARNGDIAVLSDGKSVWVE